MINREIEKQVRDAAQSFQVVAVLGPRQSGKTTLVQKIFNNHTYISLEDFDIRDRAKNDPRLFLQDYPNKHGIILDEIQHAPHLLSYIQTIADREKKAGYFVITGSQNLMVNEAVTQTLAGRIAILTLFPLSISELQQAKLLPDSIEKAVYNGSYPRVYADNQDPEKLYKNYIRSYIERDVRQIKNIADLNLFQKFVQLCAGRIGQILNLTSLGNDCGIDSKTARAWLSILEASYTVFLLYPYYKNYGKRLIKAPKIYFVDTGLACSLLRLRSSDDLLEHYLRGNLIESYIVSDIFKQFYNQDRQPSLYFWQDQSGHEVDCIIEEALHATPVEIKSGKTVSPHYFDQLNYWKQFSENSSQGFVVYSGNENQTWPDGKVLSWQSAGEILKIVDKS